MQSKLKNGYLGLCLGDALLAPYERKKNYIYTGKLDQELISRSRWQGTKNFPAGSMTDDTAMTTALILSIINNKSWNKEKIILEYLNFANDEYMSRFMGSNTRSLFKGIKTIKGYESRFEKMNDKENNQSNGSLMRIFGINFLYCFGFDQEYVFNVALNDTILTNPSIVNRDATLVYLQCCYLSLNDIEPNIDDIVAQTEPIKQVLYEIKNNIERKVDGKDKGWVCHSLYIALWAWLRQDWDLDKTFKYIAEKGGDTDTNGAITGALVGLRLKSNLDSQEENINILLSSNSNYSYSPKIGLELINKLDL